MKNGFWKSTAAALAGALLAGCATLPVPPALAAARAARAQVLQEPQGTVAQEEFAKADETLRAAENDAARDPTWWQAADESYVAQRRMEAVLVHARQRQHDAHRRQLERTNGQGGQVAVGVDPGGPPQGYPPGYPPQDYPPQGGPGGVNIIQTPAAPTAPTIIQTQAPNPQPTVIVQSPPPPQQPPPDDGRVKELSSRVEKLQAEIAQAHKDAAQREEQQRLAQAKMEKDQAAAEQKRMHDAEEAKLAKKQAQLDDMRRQLERDQKSRKMEDDLSHVGQVRRDERGLIVTLSAGKLFSNNKVQLSPAGKRTLDQLVDSLKSDPKRPIEVDGFTDSRGKQATNERVSQRRAEVVRDYLADQGISQDLLTARGMGPASPVAENTTAEGRATNRRMEFVLGSSVPAKGGAGNETDAAK